MNDSGSFKYFITWNGISTTNDDIIVISSRMKIIVFRFSFYAMYITIAELP